MSVNPWWMARSSAILFILACLGGGAVVLACGTSNGEAGTPGLDDPPTEETNGDPSKPSRPAFEAGFPDPPNDGGTGTEGGTTTNCSDPADPGSNAGTARTLDPTDDCNETPIEVKGVVSNGVDVDVYKLSATDKTGCLTNTTFPIATAGVEMCVYVRCKNEELGSTTAVTNCLGGTKKTDGTSGWEGCCAVGPAEPTPEYDCPGFATDDDSADFQIRVAPTATTKECQAYSFSYRF